jgi:hypothetical protein
MEWFVGKMEGKFTFPSFISFLSLMCVFVDDWLGVWRGFLLSDYESDEISIAMNENLSEICKWLESVGYSLRTELLRLIFWSIPFLEEKKSAFVECVMPLLSPLPPSTAKRVKGRKATPVLEISTVMDDLWSEMMQKYEETILRFDVENFERRKPLVLVLEKNLQQFPWESMPILRKYSQPVCRLPSLSFAFEGGKWKVPLPIHRNELYYIIDPDGDDKVKGFREKQKLFWKQTVSKFGKKNWKGLQGVLPSVSHFQEAVEVLFFFLFVFFFFIFFFFPLSSRAHYLPSEPLCLLVCRA